MIRFRVWSCPVVFSCIQKFCFHIAHLHVVYLLEVWLMYYVYFFTCKTFADLTSQALWNPAFITSTFTILQSSLPAFYWLHCGTTWRVTTCRSMKQCDSIRAAHRVTRACFCMQADKKKTHSCKNSSIATRGETLHRKPWIHQHNLLMTNDAHLCLCIFYSFPGLWSSI